MPRRYPEQVILVAGATGKQGGAVVQALLRDKDTPKVIRFITRNPSSSSSIKLLRKSCNAYRADLSSDSQRSREELDHAMYECDAAFFMTDPNTGEQAEVAAGKRFVDAAKRNNVKHVVFSSVFAADHTQEVPFWRSKLAIEDYVKASGLSYTILRPGAFMENFPVAPGIVRSLALGSFFAMVDWKTLPLTSTTDIGVIAAKSLLHPDDAEFQNQTISVGSGHFTVAQVQDAIEAVQGSRPWIAWIPSFIVYILPGGWKPAMMLYRSERLPRLNTSQLKQIHPGLTSLRDWVARNTPGAQVKQD